MVFAPAKLCATVSVILKLKLFPTFTSWRSSRGLWQEGAKAPCCTKRWGWGPSESPCRRRLQTARSCFSQKLRWWTSWLKGVAMWSRHVWIREPSVNEPLMKHRKAQRWHRNRSLSLTPGTTWRIPTYWPCGVRCLGGGTLIRAFRTELENLVGDAEGKRHKRMNRETESTDASARGGLPRGSDEAG